LAEQTLNRPGRGPDVIRQQRRKQAWMPLESSHDFRSRARMLVQQQQEIRH
jgi:hypothetical protein